MNFLSNLFQIGPLPNNIIEGHYDLWIVGLSYLVAVLASYVALTLVGRLRDEKNTLAKWYWLVGGAFTMGAGIWSMHFIGMLAFIMPMPMDYDLGWTGGSLLVAIFASALALYILQRNYSYWRLGLGGLLIGLGIATMHYMGMEGMRSHTNIHYLPGLFLLSIGIAVGAAEAALWLALQSNQVSVEKQFRFKTISALIMGVAICGMHYTGMAAAIFTPNALYMHSMYLKSIQPNYLAFFIAGITALIISLALTVSSYYKKMVTAVENEKEFLNAMLDNLEDGIIACDAEGRITVLNDSLQKNIPLTKDKKTIEDLSDLFSLYTADNKLVTKNKSPLHLALQGERIHGEPYIMRFKDNVSHDVIIDGQQIMNVDERKLGAVTVIHDVTELKRTEKLKNEFISIVSHELRTPLTSIRGSLGLLVSGVMGEFPDKAKNLLNIANANCERLLVLINDILDIEKIEAGKMDFQLQPLILNDVIEESLEANKMYAEKFDVTIKRIKPKTNLQVMADSGRLLQVLTNLISNACKFSPKKGTVKITIKKEIDAVRVSIIDKGPGIPKEFQPRIFQKFSQADSSATRGKGGTGLGLNISKIIIEKMGGTLNFFSKPNEGTTFYFILPEYQEQRKDKTATSIQDSSVNNKRLLICEDDENQSEYLKVLLETANFTVDVAATVTEAKTLLAIQDYHALLLDLILPDQDGISFIREIRADKKTAALHIIVISVMAQTGQDLLNGDAISVIDWLDKPIDFNKLLTSINRIKKTKSQLIPHILHVEDNFDVQHIVKSLLKGHAKVSTANTLKKAKAMIAKNDYDLAVLDLLLPDGNGSEILPLLAKYNLPVLVFSDTELNGDSAKFVKQALIKSNSTNELLLKTIMNSI